MQHDLNRAEFSGRLVKDVEIRTVGEGEKKFSSASFTLAVGRKPKKDDKGNWVKSPFYTIFAESVTCHIDEKNPNGDNYVDFGIYKNKEGNRRFINGYEYNILLDFNVDGVIYDLIWDPIKSPLTGNYWYDSLNYPEEIIYKGE